jgi:DNA-binding response OmpR family regulator
VFVVDDEQIITSTLTTILKLNGYDARGFVSPLEALDAVATFGLDLLITDVVMPELSGIDLAIRVREKRPNCRVLLFSGQAATVDLLKAARDQGHDFELLSKPIHPADILARLKQ